MEILVLAAIILGGSLLEAGIAFLFSFFTPNDEQSDVSETVLNRYDTLFAEAEEPIT